MARFDAYRLTGGAMVVDRQAGFLSDFGTRFVIPLLPRGTGPPANPRINPEFEIEGEVMVLSRNSPAPFAHLNLKAG